MSYNIGDFVIVSFDYIAEAGPHIGEVTRIDSPVVVRAKLLGILGQPEVSCLTKEIQPLKAGQPVIYPNFPSLGEGTYIGYETVSSHTIAVEWKPNNIARYHPSVLNSLRVVVPSQSKTSVKSEFPCKNCGRNNDTGVTVCWCCGGNPT